MTPDLPLSAALAPASSLPPLHRGAALRLAGKVDHDHLKHHLADLLAAHEALQATLAPLANETSGLPETRPAFSLAIDDLRMLPQLARDAAARGRALAETARRFQTGSTLFRARLLIIADDQAVLLLTLHQFVGDARSLFLLVEELLHRLDGTLITPHRFAPGGADLSLLQLDEPAQTYLSGALPPEAIQQKCGRVSAADGERIRQLALSWETTLPVVGLALLGASLANERRADHAFLFALSSEPVAAGAIGPYDRPRAVTLDLVPEGRFSDLARSVAAQVAASRPVGEIKREDTAMVAILCEAPGPRKILGGEIGVSITITPALAPGESLSLHLQEEEDGGLAMILTLPLRGAGEAAERVAQAMASAVRALTADPTARTADLFAETQCDTAYIPGTATIPVSPKQRHIENELAIIWARTLKLPSVGLDEAFFDLGGHSLMLPDLHRDIEALTGLAFDLGLILQYPTIRKFAAFCRDRLRLTDTVASRSGRRLRRRQEEQT